MQNNSPSNILMVTSYPPRVCGIATYSQDLVTALRNKFTSSLSIKICALESGDMNSSYPDEVLMRFMPKCRKLPPPATRLLL